MPTAAKLSPGEVVARRTITSYTLAPDQLRKAEGLHRTNVLLSLAGTIFGFALLAILIATRFAPRLQRFAESVSRRRIVQAFIVVPALLLTLAVLGLPLDLYAHHISRAYGLSVQSWPSWFADMAKAEFLTIIVASLFLWLIFILIRRAPRLWWLFGWFFALIVIAAMVFVSPILIDPIFNRFDPLAKTNPELTTQLRSLALASGLDIPESRIFLMHASDKVTTYNAYVTGFGATKRIVVWDTTARDLTLPQTLFVFGHEMGHYVLHHIYLGLAFTALLTFIGFFLTQQLAQFALARFGQRWQIATLGEWSSLPLLMLLASLLSFFGEPIANTFSRWEEHHADIYGLTVTQSVTKNAAQVAAQAFQLLGEKSYSYPTPSRLQVIWDYSHPPIADRIRFVLTNPVSAKAIDPEP